MIEDMSVSEIKEVVTAYRHLSRSPEFRELERQRDKAEMEENARLGYAKAEGKAEGKAESMIAIAKKLKTIGSMSNTQIAELTELSIKEIEKL